MVAEFEWGCRKEEMAQRRLRAKEKQEVKLERDLSFMILKTLNFKRKETNCLRARVGVRVKRELGLRVRVKREEDLLTHSLCRILI